MDFDATTVYAMLTGMTKKQRMLNPLLSRKYNEFLDETIAASLKKFPVISVLFSVEFFCVYCSYGLDFWQ